MIFLSKKEKGFIKLLVNDPRYQSGKGIILLEIPNQ